MRWRLRLLFGLALFGTFLFLCPEPCSAQRGRGPRPNPGLGGGGYGGGGGLGGGVGGLGGMGGGRRGPTALQGSSAGGEPTATATSPIDQKAIDKQLHEALRKVINAGADLYNRDGDRAGCYRLYEGSLITIRPLLDHHPKLQEEADRALGSAEQFSNMGERAHVLRKALGTIREGLKPVATETPIAKAPDTKPGTANPPPQPNPQQPIPGGTLWERLGGEANVRKIVDSLVILAANDPKVDFSRGGKYALNPDSVAQLKKSLVEFISQATGGPVPYKGKSMKDVHKGMGITDEQFTALATHLKTALEAYKATLADTAAVLQAVEATRKDIVEPKTTLWERLGGEAAVRKVVDDFVTLAAKDTKVNFDRGSRFKLDAPAVDRLKKTLVEFISQTTGGPLKYTGKSMKELHKGMGITESEFQAAAQDLRKALEQNGVKPAEITAVLDAVSQTKQDIVEPGK